MFFLEISSVKGKNIELVKKVLRIRSSHNLRNQVKEEEDEVKEVKEVEKRGDMENDNQNKVKVND
jgi:hypothetical protein